MPQERAFKYDTDIGLDAIDMATVDAVCAVTGDPPHYFLETAVVIGLRAYRLGLWDQIMAFPDPLCSCPDCGSSDGSSH